MPRTPGERTFAMTRLLVQFIGIDVQADDFRTFSSVLAFPDITSRLVEMQTELSSPFFPNGVTIFLPCSSTIPHQPAHLQLLTSPFPHQRLTYSVLLKTFPEQAKTNASLQHQEHEALLHLTSLGLQLGPLHRTVVPSCC